MTLYNRGEHLRVCEQELTAIYENVPGIVFYIAIEPDGEFRFQSVSRDFLAATGLRREQILGSLVRDVIPPPSRDMVLNHYREAIRSGQTVRWEEKSVYPTGQRYGEVAVTPLYDASGRPTHLIGIVHDITDRKRREERRAEDLLEAAPDAMVVLDQTGRIVLVNAQTESLFGYRREEILGQPVEVLIPRRFHDRHQAHRTTFFSQPRVRPMGVQLDLFGLRKDGSEFPVEISLSPMATEKGVLVTSAIRDVSERKQMDDTRSRLAAIVESSEDAILSVTLEGVILTWNPGAQRMFGYTEHEAVGKAITIIVPPELLDEEDKILEILRAGGRIEQFETVRVSKMDNRINVSLSISPIQDSAGKTVGYAGIERDISDRKRREQELGKVNERLRLALEAGSTGGWDFDVKTGETVLFGMAHSQLGMLPDDASGAREDFWDRVHRDDVEHYRSAIAAAREKKEHFNLEFRVIRRDGAVRWLRTQGRYHYSADGRPERLLGISLDITERKQAEQILCESEQRLRLATQVGRMYAYEWDAIKDVVTRSSEDLRRLGLSESLRGHQQQFVDTIYPDDRAQYLAAVTGLTPENPTAEVTYRARGPNGMLVWLKSSGRGFFDDNGKLLRVIGMTADVSDVKRAEELLADMTRKLIDSQEQERKRIGRELHDDINQRLALLSVELETLQQSPSELQSRVPELRRELRQISDDVQAISHDLHSSKLEILGVVAGMKSWCKEVSDRHNIEVAFRNDFPGNLPLELGIPLFRILQQAVDNAIRHSGAKRIEVQLWEDNDEIHLIVRDSGKGFDVESATRGKGLGLTSMKERVRLVNGTIDIDSKPREGTRIDVRIPLEQRSKAERLSA